MLGAFLRKFLLSYLFPSCFFILLNGLLYLLYFNEGKSISLGTSFVTESSNYEFIILVYVVLSTIIAYALFSGNYQIVRLFEGYKFQQCLLLFTKINKKIRYRISKRLGKVRSKIDKQDDNPKQHKLFRIESKLIYKIETIFPKYHEDIMPTKLGNIFRSFEDYPREKYGIETVTIWPRLLLVLPATTHRHIEDAQNSLMFFLVASFLSFLFSFEVFLLALIGVKNNWKLDVFVAFFSISIIIGYFLYRISLDSALNFGDIIKSLFDLYRKVLLAELQIPIDEPLTKERKRWEKLSNFLYFKQSKENPFV